MSPPDRGRVRNRDELTDHGNRPARAALLDIVESALAAVHPDRLVPGVVRVEGRTVVVDGIAYDLDEVGEVTLLGAGKGASAVAAALRDVLGDRIDRGLVVDKHGHGREVPGIEVVEASHPVPDEAGRRAAERVLERARSADEDDLVIVCITGGASALLPAPAGEIGLSELAGLTADLLASGAPIDEINAVRKHLSAIKGGRLAAAVAPASVVSLIVVDEVAGEPWGPTVPDETTYGDAVAVLERRGLWADLPASIREHLERGQTGAVAETPDRAALAELATRTQTVVLADGTDAAEAADDRARALGYESTVLSTVIEGESRHVGTCLAGIAREAAARGRPLEPPCALVTGGETTVSVGDAPGEGGPNQECALAVALAVAGEREIAAVSIGTDGTDGPTDVAGGLVDGETVARATERGVDLFDRLDAHDAATALRALDDAVYTGPTGTNVMDLRVLVVGGPPDGDRPRDPPSDA